MDTTQTQLILEIANLLEITPDEMTEINKNFQDLMTMNDGTTADMIRACQIYDPAAFLAGAMITTSVLDLVRANFAEKDAERERLEGGFRDVV